MLKLLITSCLMSIAVDKLLKSRKVEYDTLEDLQTANLDGIGEVLTIEIEYQGNRSLHTFLRDGVEMALDEAEAEMIEMVNKCKEKADRVAVSEYN